jgi:Na+-translocating ferredoxin:NAD+ oxidoreductase RNF subunit RnfB
MDFMTVLNIIALPAVLIGVVGLGFGLVLAWSARKFAVHIDEKILKIKHALPGVNCGACGQTGCESFAKAVFEGRAKADGCPVGGADVAAEVASIMGVTLTNTISYVARVHCGGYKGISRVKYHYAGIKDCTAAFTLHGGPLMCSYGCVGFGNCAKSCAFGAIVIEDGLARILEDKCKGCEKCVAACPKKLISMQKRGTHYTVTCRSLDKGPVTKKNCDAGCIACTKCVKTCPHQAIAMNGNVAVIDPEKCVNCGACMPVCPTGAIRQIIPGWLPAWSTQGDKASITKV